MKIFRNSLTLILSLVLISSSVPKASTVTYATSPAWINRIPRALFFDESKLGISCNSHANCDPPFIVCTGTDEVNVMGICEHKNLIPMTHLEIQGIVVIIAASMLAISAGLGGGSLFVPLMMIFFGMNAHLAIPLSNALTFANSVVSYALSFNTKHPEIPHKPIVDFNVAILFNPMMMIGSFVGVILQTLLPGIVSISLLFVTLVLATYKGAKGTITTYFAENAKIAKLAENKEPQVKTGDGVTETEMKVLNEQDDDEDRHEHYDGTLDEQTNKLRIDAIDRISQTEAEVFPWDKMKLVLASFAVTVICPFILGGKGMNSFLGISRCTPMYFLGMIAYAVIVLYLWYKAYRIVWEEEEQKSKVAGGWPFKEAIKWEKNKIFTLSAYMFVVGVFSAIVGVGGGIYIIPILTDLGFHVQVTGATSLFLVFWAKLASTQLFASSGTQIFDYTVILCLLATIGSYISQKALKKVLQKLDRQSIVKGLFACFVGIACTITCIKICGLLFGDNNGFDIFAFSHYC